LNEFLVDQRVWEEHIIEKREKTTESRPKEVVNKSKEKKAFQRLKGRVVEEGGWGPR